MFISEEQQAAFVKATNCWICGDKLVTDKSHQDYKKKQPVRDHCHYTGKYQGPAHNECNRQFRKPKFTPIFFHNLSGYDSHLFINNLGKTQGNIKCIPNNEEKYISFSKDIVVDKEKKVMHELRFLDSCKFMPSSLGTLVANITACSKCESCCPGDCLKRYIKDGKIIQYKGIGLCGNCRNCLLINKPCFKPITKHLRETRKIFGKKTNFLTRKGAYPYDYVDNLDRLSETQLPPKEAFHSKLNDKHISDEDYEHALKVWEAFDCKTLKDYHDLYLESDLLLLADVFETFRDLCMTNYELDPAWCYTAPGLARDAALKMTKVELKLLTDIEMLDMFEEGIRGGISSIMHRHGKANNKYMGEDFNSKELIKYLIYQDVNNLYGWAMSMPLPTKGFKWMTEEEL